MPQIKNEGGLWDESCKIFPLIKAVPNSTESYWKFPSGATVSFSHLEHEKNVYDWQGAQIPLIMFDELNHFTKKQFFYMLSRNRSTCGVRPYIRATTNPDKKSWIRPFIDWWIYPKGHEKAGLPIPERSGVIRYFIVVDDKVIWKDSRDEFENPMDAKSFTFIAASIYDNKILLEKDPGYLANLKALPKVERDKLLGGNWDAEDKPGELFQKQWFPVIRVAPSDIVDVVRYWDRAASESDTADFTVGLKLGKTRSGGFVILDVVRFRGTPSKVETAVVNTAAQDGNRVRVGIEQDPGQAGVMESRYLVNKLAGYTAEIHRATNAKTVRAGPVSSQAEVGNIAILEAPWNEDFLAELESFPDGSHDDQVDALSGAFNMLVGDVAGTMTEEMSTLESSDFDSKENRW